MTNKRLEVELSLDADGYAVGARRAGEMTSRLKRNFDELAQGSVRVDQAVHRIGNSFRSTVITMGALRFAFMDINDILLSFPRGVASVSGDFQRLQTLMEGLSKSTDDAARKLEGLADMNSLIGLAKNSPFDIKSLSDSFVKFKSAGIDPLTGGMRALVDSVAKFGGSGETLKRASIAIQQMAGKGVISMEELRQQLGEAVPNAMQLMARGMGMSVGKLTDLVSKGVVQSRQALAKMFAQMELDAHGASDRLMNTFPGALERLKTEFQLFQKVVGDQGFMTVLEHVTKSLSEFLASAEGRKFATEIGQFLRGFAEGAVVLGKALYDNLELLKTLGGALLALYGGSKLSGALDGVRARIKEQQAAVDEVRRANVARYEAENAAIQKQMSNQRRLHADALKTATALEQGAKSHAAGMSALIESQVAAERRLQAERGAQIAKLRGEQAIALQKLAASESRPTSALLGGGSVAAPSDVEALRQRAVAIGANVEATKQLHAASQAKIATLEKGLQVVKADTAATLERADGYRKLANAHREQIRQMGIAISNNNLFAASAATAGSAVGNFAKSLLSTGIHAVAFSLLVTGIVALWDSVTGAARRAKEAQMSALRIKRGLATGQDLKDKDEQIRREEREIDSRQEQIDLLKTGNSADRARAGRFEAQLANAKVRLANLKDLRDEAKKAVDQTNSLNAAGEVFRGIELQVEASEAVEKFRKLNADKVLELGKAATAKEKEKIQSEFPKLGLEMKKALLQGFEDALKNIDQVALARGLKDDQSKGALRKSLADRVKNLHDEIKAIEGSAIGPGKDKKPKTRHIDESDPYLDFLKQQEVVVAEMTAKIEANADGLFTAAEVLEVARKKVREMATGDKPKLLTRDFLSGELRSLYPEEIEKAAVESAAASQAKNAERIQQRFNDALAQITANKERIETALSENSLADQGSEERAAERLIAQFTRVKDQVVPLLAKTQMSWEDFVNSLRKGSGFISVLNLSEQLRGKNVQTEIDLITDERERAVAQSNQTIYELQRQLETKLRSASRYGATAQELEQLQILYTRTFTAISGEAQRLSVALETPVQKLVRTWADATRNLENATAGWMQSLVDGLVDGNLKIGDFLKKVAGDIAKIKLQEALSTTGGLAADGASKLGSFLGLGGGSKAQDTAAMLAATEAARARSLADLGAQAATNSLTASLQLLDSITRSVAGSFGANSGVGLFGQLFGSGGGLDTFDYGSALGFLPNTFALGGIMGSSGPKRLRTYARGGIADRPQLAVYGEGDMNEAIVPLPDGRTIPVSLRGGQSGPPEVTVNVINQSGQSVSASQKGSPRFDGRQMILDVVLSAMNTPGPFRDGLRGATGAS